MKRLAVSSPTCHADVHALRDALSQIERLGCDAIVCAGDLVDCGLFPEETLGLLIEKGIPCIRGNHDRWAANDTRRFAQQWGMSSRTNAIPLQSFRYPASVELEGVRIVVCTRVPDDDMMGIYPDIAENDAVTLLERSWRRCCSSSVTRTSRSKRRVADGAHDPAIPARS